LSPSEINLFDWGAELLLHRAYEPASEVFGQRAAAVSGIVRMAMGVGVAAYALGAYDLAAQRLCEASDVDPSDEKPYLFLGKLQAVGSDWFLVWSSVWSGLSACDPRTPRRLTTTRCVMEAARGSSRGDCAGGTAATQRR